jgi:hypothetical protein
MVTSDKQSRNPVPPSNNMITQTYKLLFMASFTIVALCLPLIAYTFHLWQHHTGSANLISLNWHELLLLLTLVVLPLGIMKLFKINWTSRDIPG